jgi:gas vesicle protein
MFLVLSVFYSASLLMRETARVGRASGREAVKNELLAAADLTDKAAYKAMIGGIVGGCITRVGGLAGVGFARQSGKVYDVEIIGTGGRANFARGVANNRAAQYNTYGQSAREMAAGLGTLTQAIYDGSAQFTLADADRLKAQAAALQEVVDNWSDLHGSHTAAGQRALDALKELISALHATALAIIDNQ